MIGYPNRLEISQRRGIIAAEEDLINSITGRRGSGACATLQVLASQIEKLLD